MALTFPGTQRSRRAGAAREQSSPDLQAAAGGAERDTCRRRPGPARLPAGPGPTRVARSRPPAPRRRSGRSGPGPAPAAAASRDGGPGPSPRLPPPRPRPRPRPRPPPRRPPLTPLPGRASRPHQTPPAAVAAAVWVSLAPGLRRRGRQQRRLPLAESPGPALREQSGLRLGGRGASQLRFGAAGDGQSEAAQEAPR